MVEKTKYNEILNNLGKGRPLDSQGKVRYEIYGSLLVSDISPALQERVFQELISFQNKDGYWDEYPYEGDGLNVGFYGAITTCFCVVGLIKSYNETKNNKLLESAVKACDWLYQQESNGFFKKSKINRSDVLNTNILCAYSLLYCSSVLEKESSRIELYNSAANRAILRVIRSQNLNGSFPYLTGGLTVPFLYHFMTLAILKKIYNDFNDSDLIYGSVINGIRFSKRILANDGKIKWEIEKFNEKGKVLWAYAWAYSCIPDTKIISHIGFGKEFFYKFENSRVEDKFYSAWIIFAFHFMTKINEKKKRVNLVWLLNVLGGKIKTIQKLSKIMVRRLSCKNLDKGPVEYHK